MNDGEDSIPERAFAKHFPKSEVQVDLLAHLPVAESRHCEMLVLVEGRLAG
jgi:hypothetical protein